MRKDKKQKMKSDGKKIVNRRWERMEQEIEKIFIYLQIMVSTMELQMKQSFARPMFRFCLILNPIMNTIFLYELFLQKGMDAFWNYVVLGAGLMGIWSCICFSSVGDINRERYSGTLPFIYVAPGGFGLIIFGKILGNTLLSMLTFVISYVTAGVISGHWMVIEHLGYFCISMFLTILCFIVISMCFAYIMMLSRKTELYMNLIEIPLVFICGFTFPIEILPAWAQGISNALAPTWAVRMLRMSVGEVQQELYVHYFVILAVELMIMVIFTMGLYYWMDKRIRIRATLEVS